MGHPCPVLRLAFVSDHVIAYCNCPLTPESRLKSKYMAFCDLVIEAARIARGYLFAW